MADILHWFCHAIIRMTAGHHLNAWQAYWLAIENETVSFYAESAKSDMSGLDVRNVLPVLYSHLKVV